MNKTIEVAAKEIVEKIIQLPDNSEFTFDSFFHEYQFENSQLFDLTEQVKNTCEKDDIYLENTQEGMILGMPWVYKYKKSKMKLSDYNNRKNIVMEFIKKNLTLTEEETLSLAFGYIDDIDALYVSLPNKEGFSVLVAPDGKLLYADGSLSYDSVVEAYKNGKRTEI